MLRKRELAFNFLVLKFCSRLCLLPLKFRDEGESFKVGKQEGRGWRKSVWLLLYTLVLLRTLFSMLRLGQSLLFPELYFKIKDISLHCILAFGWVLCSWWAFELFVLGLDTTVLIFNETFEQYQNETEEALEPRAGSGSPPRWRNYTKEDWIIVFLPCIPGNILVIITVIYYYEPDRLFFLYSAWIGGRVESLPSAWTWSFCLALELVLSALTLVPAIFSLLVQLCFFQKISAVIQTIAMRPTRRVMTGADMRAKLRHSRQLQLWLQLFNSNFAYANFSFKINLSLVSIIGLFFAVKLWETLPMDAFGNLVIVLDDIGTFLILYDKAFKVAEEIRELRRDLQVSIGSTLWRVFPPQRLGLRRELESIPPLAVRVGDFHNFERETTPRILDFIMRNVLGLLITFK